MPSVPELTMKITKAANAGKTESGEMVIVLQRPYAYLASQLKRTFSNGNKARVIIDQRMGERRELRRYHLNSWHFSSGGRPTSCI